MTYILLFGITGDLSKRMLLPSLERLLTQNKIQDVCVYGVSRRDLDVSDVLTTSLNKPLAQIQLHGKVTGIKLADNLQDYIDFKNKLNLTENDQLIIYLSVPPTSALQYVELLGKSNLNADNVKLMLEKPFGIDLDSANHFLSVINQFFKEEQVYKIDHYLAKRNAQALMEFRNSNDKLTEYWNDQYIDKIEIVAAEVLDIQGRGVFYEQTGALRDFMQGHLFELLLLTMCNTNTNNQEHVIQSRIACAQSLSISSIDECTRGQYIGYKEEVNNAASVVETYAKVNLHSNMSEWVNTKFILLTGKGLDHKESSINVYFKNGIKFKILISPIGDFPDKFEYINLAPIDTSKYLDGYDAVFYDAIEGNKLIFTSTNEILTSWKIFMPILDNWKNNDKNLKLYEKGSAFIN